MVCLRTLVSKGARKLRLYDVAKVGMRLSPRLMLLVLAFTRSWRPELCILHAQRGGRYDSQTYRVLAWRLDTWTRSTASIAS